jgi:hypothetical protein
MVNLADKQNFMSYAFKGNTSATDKISYTGDLQRGVHITNT